jgi:hypothetical protein
VKSIYAHAFVLHASTAAFYFFALDFLIGVSVKHAVILGVLQLFILASKTLYLIELEKEKMREYEEEAKAIDDLLKKMENNKND